MEAHQGTDSHQSGGKREGTCDDGEKLLVSYKFSTRYKENIPKWNELQFLFAMCELVSIADADDYEMK